MIYSVHQFSLILLSHWFRDSVAFLKAEGRLDVFHNRQVHSTEMRHWDFGVLSRSCGWNNSITIASMLCQAPYRRPMLHSFPSLRNSFVTYYVCVLGHYSLYLLYIFCSLSFFMCLSFASQWPNENERETAQKIVHLMQWMNGSIGMPNTAMSPSFCSFLFPVFSRA